MSASQLTREMQNKKFEEFHELKDDGDDNDDTCNWLTLQGQVVRKVDSAIRWIVIFSTFVRRDKAGRNIRFCQRNK